MLELRIVTAGSHVPLFDLPAALGRSRAAREIGDAIEGLIAFMDELQGDVDIEDGHDREGDTSDLEPDDDWQGDQSWSEWQTRGRHKLNPGGGEPVTGRNGWMVREDDEDDDHDTGVEDDPVGIDGEEDCCVAGDDTVRSGPAVNFDPNRKVFYIGSDDDAERPAQPPSWTCAAASD